jgi:phosphatidylserine decarboxylase
MRNTEYAVEKLDPVPLPANIVSVQPGGGFCYRVELLWGRWRRWYLKRFRRRYVERMAECRRGSMAGAPHEILDVRDLKYCQNLCDCRWQAADDLFSWRNTIPLARWGLAEALILGLPLLLIAGLIFVLWPPLWPLGLPPLFVLIWLLYFFRDPVRPIPSEDGLLVAPADGKIVEVTRLDHDPFVNGPAIRIGIFLSIFNVHINRMPCKARVVELRYAPGLFLNAINPQSAIKNENMWIGLQETKPPHRKLVVRQIAGLIARRIVCAPRPGETLSRGEQFGMIKLGSRTELIVPHETELALRVKVGDKVKAGRTVLARYELDSYQEPQTR